MKKAYKIISIDRSNRNIKRSELIVKAISEKEAYLKGIGTFGISDSKTNLISVRMVI